MGSMADGTSGGFRGPQQTCNVRVSNGSPLRPTTIAVDQTPAWHNGLLNVLGPTYLTQPIARRQRGPTGIPISPPYCCNNDVSMNAEVDVTIRGSPNRMDSEKPLTMASGARLPLLIYGTDKKKSITDKLTRTAVSLGFRAVDTANQPCAYEESLTGEALRAERGRGLSRGELWVRQLSSCDS